MKIITIIGRTGPVKYKVFENYQEFNASGKVLKPVIFADEDNYVLSDNGYYLPIVKALNEKVGNYTYRSVFVPRGQYRFRIFDKYGNSLEPNLKSFIWHFDIVNKQRKSYTHTDIYFAILINKDINIETAYKLAYKKKDIKGLRDKLFALMEIELFMNKINKELIMKNLPKEKKEPIDQDWLMKHIKEVIKDINYPDKMYRKKCLELATDILFKQTKGKNTKIKTNGLEDRLKELNIMEVKGSSVLPDVFENN